MSGLSFDAYEPDGSPRVFAGVFRPPFDEISEDEWHRFAEIGPMYAVDHRQRAWSQGKLDRPLYEASSSQTAIREAPRTVASKLVLHGTGGPLLEMWVDPTGYSRWAAREQISGFLGFELGIETKEPPGEPSYADLVNRLDAIQDYCLDPVRSSMLVCENVLALANGDEPEPPSTIGTR